MTTKKPNEITLPGWVIPVILALATWSGWVTTQLYGRPSFADMDNRIATTAPYVQDRNLILSALNRTEKQVDRLLVEVRELRIELNK